jgi:hypothetical protein
MSKIPAMFLSILIMILMMTATAILINYMEGDILPDSSPWSFISYGDKINND